MKIFVYPTGQAKDLVAGLLNYLDGSGIAYFVDENMPTPNWWTRNLLDNCCVFDKDFNYYNVKFPESFIPFVLCAADNSETPDWPLLRTQLMGETIGIQTPIIQKVSLKRAGLDDIHEDLSTPIKKAKDVLHYKFGTYYDNDHDCMFYEIIKPNTPHGYVVAIKDYSHRGHRPFFSSLFVLGSWGTPADLDFLAYTWGMLLMAGEFDIDLLVKEAIEQVNENEDLKPRVFLNDVKRLIELYNKNGWPYFVASIDHSIIS